MDWSNEITLQFIESLRNEPCIWDPKNINYKNRSEVQNAWERLKKSLPVNVSVEDMKRKRNILLTQYRFCLKRMRRHLEFEEYKTSWFAFDALHSYLGDLYDSNMRSKYNDENVHYQDISYLDESNPGSPASNEFLIEKLEFSDSDTDSHQMPKKRRTEPDMFVIKQEPDDSSFANDGVDNSKSNHEGNETQVTECDLYGQLIASKLKQLNEIERLTLMNKIDNLVFKHLMDLKKRDSLS